MPSAICISTYDAHVSTGRIRHLAADIVDVDEREYDASDEEGVDDEVDPGPPDVQ